MRVKTIVYKYFLGCKSREEAKTTYRTLAKRHHPDMSGGNAEIFKLVVAEYESINAGNCSFPVSNSSQGSHPFEKETWYKQNTRNPFDYGFGFDAFNQAMKEAMEKELRQREAFRKAKEYERTKAQHEYNSKNPNAAYWEYLKLTSPLIQLIEDLIIDAIKSNKTANWMLMELYKIDDLTLVHFKFMRYCLKLQSNSRIELKESWCTVSYNNYLAIRQIKWE